VLLLVLMSLLAACHRKPRQNRGEVDQAELSALIEGADLVTVLDQPYENGKVIWLSSARSDIEEFKAAVSILWPPDGSHCLCLGYPAIRLYRRQAEILRITSFDWNTIRWQTSPGPIWHDDVALKDPKKWLRWFDSRKIPVSVEAISATEERRIREDASHGRPPNKPLQQSGSPP
jgi:hypothetical protein